MTTCHIVKASQRCARQASHEALTVALEKIRTTYSELGGSKRIEGGVFYDLGSGTGKMVRARGL